MSSHDNGANFECAVCLESLDSPAPNEAVPVPAQTRNASLEAVDKSEICSTSCGHMYHKYCIQKWFNEQEKNTCPSCRKACGTTLIRLFPNLAPDPPLGQGKAVIPRARTVPQVKCPNPACEDIIMLHTTLVSDYNELLTKFIATEDALQIKDGEIASLREIRDTLTGRLAELEAFVGDDVDDGDNDDRGYWFWPRPAKRRRNNP